MSRNIGLRFRHFTTGKPNAGAHLSAARGDRDLIPAIISMAATVIAVVIWLGLHPSIARSEVETSVVSQPDRVAVDSNQSSGTVTGGPSIHFPEPSHDFGTISQGTKVAHTFAVKNTGSEPLKLIRAQASWGCTAAVLTVTDIPPGGEGKIEVTFDSSHKKGKQEKTITVESNDLAHPKATLRISLLIEVEFDFETPALNIGRVRKGESVSKTAVLLIKNPSKRGLLILNSQSSHIVARLVESPGGDEGRIDVEITVKPETPAGSLNEAVVAELSDASYPAARLQIAGTVIGNFEVNPETVSFMADTSRTATDQAEQRVQVSGTQDASAFRLLGVKDFDNLLAIDIDTLTAGERYEIRAKPNENALKLGRNASGEIRILTDDSEQTQVSVRYSIILSR